MNWTRSRLPSAVVAAFMVLASGCLASAANDEPTRPTSESTLAVDAPAPSLVPPSTGGTGNQAGGVALDPGDHEFALGHDGRDRSYRVHLPVKVEAPAAVMVALHGGGGNGADFQKKTGWTP